MLVLILFANLWEEEDPAILAELGEYIGFDLANYWPWE